MSLTPQQCLTPTKPVHGLVLHPNGKVEFHGTIYSATAGYFGYELDGAVRLFKAPGRRPMVFLYPSEKLVAIRHVPGHGWCNCTRHLPTRWPERHIQQRWQRFLSNLSRASRSRVVWLRVTAVTNPYRNEFALEEDGQVSVAGQPFCAGDQVALADGRIISHSGTRELTVYDERGVCDRFRHDPAAKSWQRLLRLASVAGGRQPTGITCDHETGRVIFEHPGIAPIVIGCGEPFEIHLSPDRVLARLDQDGSLLDWDAAKQELREFLYLDGRWWHAAGAARDEWISQSVGCPQQGRVGSLEAMPGITVQFDGVVEILGRAYVNGEAVDLYLSGVHIRREADVNAWLFVQAPTRAVALYYGVDGEWYRATPHSAERQFDSWLHHGPRGSWAAWAIVHYTRLANDAPLRSIAQAVAFAQRHLGPLGLILTGYFEFFVLFVGAPLGFLCRAAKHVARAYRESE